MPMSGISDVAALEACVGRVPGPRDLKVITYLDDSATRWIAASPCLFAAFGNPVDIAVSAGGGEPGFVRVDGQGRLSIPRGSLDHAQIARVGHGFGSLFLAPGMDETLRVNGRVSAITEDWITIAVEECYLHCAKALIRSDFWAAQPCAEAPQDDPSAHLAASRFMALATVDSDGRADLSPKGDPAGALLKRVEGDVWYPDRPGNRRVDSFRNILTQPRIAALALIPGVASIALITGSASLFTDESVRAEFAVNDRTPKLVTRIEQVRLRTYRSEALLRARLWPVTRTAEGLDPAEIFKTHVKLSRTGGVAAALARATVSIPGMVRKGLESDYKNNLY